MAPDLYCISIRLILDQNLTNFKVHNTPFCVSRMMAEMQLDDIGSLLADKPFFTVYEPACGSAGMLLAIAEVVMEKGFNPERHLWVSCTDIDPVASGMAYIQLSLKGIPGEVVTGNALNGERRRVMHTPAHWLGNWSYRLKSVLDIA
ncbi:N-6 DNA methylase [Rahnella sp. BCC 1045]|uniref:N-6 DNA methylase n=1 Tax=Rahnella sp. BCC 1045 TaxID=2816251 RepID=UPI0020B8182F|nr:N-6 DNA methylase [Rahnella sp. BCC 1045]